MKIAFCNNDNESEATKFCEFSFHANFWVNTLLVIIHDCAISLFSNENSLSIQWRKFTCFCIIVYLFWMINTWR